MNIVKITEFLHVFEL